MSKKRGKIGTKRYYTKKLDEVFSKYVRSRGACEKCGSRQNLQCAHVHSRTKKALRWDPMNALCLCVRCHLYWQHKEPREFTHWFDDKYRERAIYLDKNKNNIYKMTPEEMKDLYEHYKNRLKDC